MTFQHYLDSANRYYVQNSKDLRYGQAMMNFLCLVCPELDAKITGTDVDPFYDDNRVPVFLEYLGNHWDNYFTN
ncbi:hypothetical protein SCRM01_226 [Synechococcus phage S-CRM01]|uniref:hypothetical protein n=1 Tax=Synechococcus phage S-CRM01 TaxID=1026955 RepID=UPI000209E433|nr:hypothetical protein SCRM01_226 [Synechococcus phage S-CRM01]AEC53172.1 hypothetical protein SCRM01_226 [Synechococcus phage S-CRM01]